MIARPFLNPPAFVSLTVLLGAFLLMAMSACGSADAPGETETDSGSSRSSDAVNSGTGSVQDSSSTQRRPTAGSNPPPGSAQTSEESGRLPQQTDSTGKTDPATVGSSSLVGEPSSTPTVPAPPTATPIPTPTPPPGERDRAALIAFYQATDGDNWKLNRRWLSDEPLDQWQGVTTGRQGEVVGLSLPSNRLMGELPPEFGDLLNLNNLDISDNQLTGCIPVTLWYNGRLGGYQADLDPCPEPERADLVSVLEAMGVERHTGKPVAWGSGVRFDESGNVVKLEHHQIRQRGPIFPIVPELAKLPKLQVLRFRGSGPLPPELGELSELNYLRLTYGEVTGKIPPELGNLANLTHLYLRNNQLSGEIPAELGQLSNLTHLYLQNNQLSGEIPAELGNLPSLIFVNVWGELLSGCIPSSWPVRNGSTLPLCSAADAPISQQQADREFKALAAVFEDLGGPGWYVKTGRSNRKVEANNNWLTDKPLGEWDGVHTDNKGYVVGLDLRVEGLKGTLPAEIEDLVYLRSLYIEVMEDRRWEGEIPKELGNLAHLRDLWITSIASSYSESTTSIPSELGNLSNLKSLRLNWNLSGEIPRELGNLSNLRVLTLSGNGLGGEIPRELGNLSNLRVLTLLGNFEGEVPKELGNLSKLYELDLGNYHCVPAILKDQLYSFTGRFC